MHEGVSCTLCPPRCTHTHPRASCKGLAPPACTRVAHVGGGCLAREDSHAAWMVLPPPPQGGGGQAGWDGGENFYNSLFLR